MLCEKNLRKEEVVYDEKDNCFVIGFVDDVAFRL